MFFINFNLLVFLNQNDHHFFSKSYLFSWATLLNFHFYSLFFIFCTLGMQSNVSLCVHRHKEPLPAATEKHMEWQVHLNKHAFSYTKTHKGWKNKCISFLCTCIHKKMMHCPTVTNYVRKVKSHMKIINSAHRLNKDFRI